MYRYGGTMKTVCVLTAILGILCYACTLSIASKAGTEPGGTTKVEHKYDRSYE